MRVERGSLLELDAQPEGLDLNDVHFNLAQEKGVAVAISSGASTPAQLDFVRFGVDQAHRSLEQVDVLNT